jgi:hypothetical protein
MAMRKEGEQTPYRGPFLQNIVCASFLAGFDVTSFNIYIPDFKTRG